MKYSPSVFIQKVLRRLRLYKNRAISLRRKMIRRPWIFEDGYSIEDNTQVTLYTDRDDLFPGYSARIKPAVSKKARTVKVVLIAVAKNEAATAEQWVASIIHQTRLPDEVIVVDTGSTDNTVQILKDLIPTSPVPFQVIEAPGTNISKGRNLAIRSSQLEHIAVTDFGTRPGTNWLEKLILPFEISPDTEVSGGWYETIGENGEPYRWRKWISLLEKNPQDILSPSVSIAFTRKAWQKAGGYPEWLTLTGEDTYFDLELKRTCRWWAFSPEALVEWEAPNSMWAYLKKMYRWSTGDGETGMRASAYWYAAIISTLTLLGISAGLFLILLGAFMRLPLLLIAGALAFLAVFLRAARSGKRAGYSTAEVVLVIGIMAAQALGFMKGASRRQEVTRRRLKEIKAIFFILAGIPIDDTGGGARSTQISLELLRRQYAVCYIHKYPKSEIVELNLSIRHPNLFTSSASAFSIKDFCARYDIDLSHFLTYAVVELPHADWLPLIDDLKVHGAKVVYELIDEWDSHLGEGWYSKEIELKTVQKATTLTATAPILKDRLEAFSQRPVCLLTNAVNLRLFNCRKNFPVPEDLPTGELVITYTGALYGSWFDWDLLVCMAREYPKAQVMVIGDYRGQCPVSLPNLHFLGLKPQNRLPAYLAHTDVAVIPWKVNDITQATSPLKLYEYLAMHVPVIAPDLLPLKNIPAVYLSQDKAAFLRNIQTAAAEPFNTLAVDEFIKRNSWETRVTQLLDLMGFASSKL